MSNDCPLDVLATAGEVCRPAVGTCDVEETCDGVSAVCPADVTIDTDGDGITDATTINATISGSFEDAQLCAGLEGIALLLSIFSGF